MEFYKGTFGKRQVVLVRSGIGKVNAAVATEILCSIYNCRAIINTGIAGSLDAEINIGDIVLSTDALEHDMDVTGLGYERGVIPDQEISIYEADEKLRKVAYDSCRKVNPDINVYEGRVISGDKFVSDSETKKDLVSTFNGMCTEMEGAAIAQASYLNNIPYVIIRAISDKADGSDVMYYPEFEKKAAQNCAALVEFLIKNI
jgi:adenosylhomocysteine nucleosidase